MQEYKAFYFMIDFRCILVVNCCCCACMMFGLSVQDLGADDDMCNCVILFSHICLSYTSFLPKTLLTN